MTFKQLEYFAAVARTLSFTEAANEVFVSQPALSRGIVSLENELGSRCSTATTTRSPSPRRARCWRPSCRSCARSSTG